MVLDMSNHNINNCGKGYKDASKFFGTFKNLKYINLYNIQNYNCLMEEFANLENKYEELIICQNSPIFKKRLLHIVVILTKKN